MLYVVRKSDNRFDLSILRYIRQKLGVCREFRPDFRLDPWAERFSPSDQLSS